MKKRLGLLLGMGSAALLTAGTASAQSSDLPVTNPGALRESNGNAPEPGIGQRGGGYVPGLPPATAAEVLGRGGAGGAGAGAGRAAGGAGAGAAGTAAAGSGVGRGSAVLDDYGGGGMEEMRPMGPPPTFHVVHQGDTLWSISQQYFGTPMQWPRLWSLNPQVTNPHWLFPGLSIRLAQGGAAAPASPTAPTTPTTAPAPPAPSGIVFQQNGFVDPDQLAAAATIIGSPEEKTMLATLDQAYVATPEGKPPLPVGERYSIYRVVSHVRHPGSGKDLGAIVEILGDARILPRGTDTIGRAVITDSLNPIERGHRVGPLMRQFKIVQPRDNRVDLDATVCSTLRPEELVGTEVLVFLDRGTDDGLEVGNHFSVVRRGDGYAPLRTQKPLDDPRYPREVIGEVLVVDVRRGVSTGLVLRSVKEIRIGDRLEARAAR